MPLWRTHRQNTFEWLDSDTSQLMLANLNDYNQKKSLEVDGRQNPYILHDRPKTAHGATKHSRHQEIIIPGLGPDHDYTYISSMSSSSASVSTDPGTRSNEGNIGVALGSPTASPVISVVRRSQLATFGYPTIQYNSSPKPQPSPMIRPHTAHSTKSEQFQSKGLPPPPEPSPKLKRWPTVGGLLKRVKTQKHKRELDLKRPSTSAGHGETRHIRTKSAKSMKMRSPIITHDEAEVAWEQISKRPQWLRSKKRTESEPVQLTPSIPHLDILIPDAGLDRYSVMFSSVLQNSSKSSAMEPSATVKSFPVKQTILTRRQNGKERLVITSPTYVPPGKAAATLRRMPSVHGPKPPKKALSLFPALSPLPDTPAHSKEPTKNVLRRSKSATAVLTTPTQDTFLEASCSSPKRAKSERMPHTPPLDAYFRHFPMPAGMSNSPATFAESWSEVPPVSVSVPDLRDTVDRGYPTKVHASKNERIDSPEINISSWEENAEDVFVPEYTYSPPKIPSAFSGPSSSCSPHSSSLTAGTSPQSGNLTTPSPRHWHGYDTPHSPLVEMARTVYVTNIQSARASIVLSASSSARTSVQLLEKKTTQPVQSTDIVRAVPKKLDPNRKRGTNHTADKGNSSTLGNASRMPEIVRLGSEEEIPRRTSITVEVEDVEGMWKEVETAWGVRESQIGLGVMV